MTEFKNIIQAERKFFRTGIPAKTVYREKMLKRMLAWIETNETQILKALQADLGKAPFEGYMTEVGIVKEELRYALKHIRSWAGVKKVVSPLTQFPACSFQYPEPYGVVLILSPWNYPFQLTVVPLLSAIAAGNCVVVKPSGQSVHTSKLLQRMVRQVFRPDHVSIVNGGRGENAALLEEKFDYIFFTGSVAVGKLVMKKAAEHLTPVSLELGGKSPCIVDETADIPMAARRIVWGKFLNAGQTCVAPDYILVQHSVQDKLLHQMEKMIRKMYGSDPILSPDYPHIINRRHYDRLCSLMKEGTVAIGGQRNEDRLTIAPTVLLDVTWEDAVMKEEIFGPILPVISFFDLKEAVHMVQAQPRPLALYLFTGKKSREKRILSSLSFGGGCINDTVVHLASTTLPFGGVGASGMGSYHGKAGFDTFTHQKSIMKKAVKIDLPVRYAPYGKKLKLLKAVQH